MKQRLFGQWPWLLLAGLFLFVLLVMLDTPPAAPTTARTIATPSHTPAPIFDPAGDGSCLSVGAALRRALAAVSADGTVMGEAFAVRFHRYNGPRPAWYVAAPLGAGGREVGLWASTVDPSLDDTGGLTTPVNDAARDAAFDPRAPRSPLFNPGDHDAQRAIECARRR